VESEPHHLSALCACFGLDALQARQYNYSSIKQCMPACRQQGYSLAIITPDFACRCAIATPDAMAEVQETECRTGGKGATVFYDHDGTLQLSVASQCCETSNSEYPLT